MLLGQQANITFTVIMIIWKDFRLKLQRQQTLYLKYESITRVSERSSVVVKLKIKLWEQHVPNNADFKKSAIITYTDINLVTSPWELVCKDYYVL